jgi:SulP family sulfate permease
MSAQTRSSPPLDQRNALQPALLDSLRTYSASQFAADAGAGVIVGIVALPLAIAFAIASGVTPERGLATAIIAGFLISAFGGSRTQIGGPTGACVVIVAGIVEMHGIDGLLIATFMAGAMLVLFGVLRAGAVIRFVPQPLVVGFTSGIAVLILSSQLRDALGLQMTQVPTDFVEKLLALWHHRSSVSLPAVGVTLATLAILLAWPRVPGSLARRVPGPFVALVLVTGAVALLDLNVDTIGSRFGDMPHGLAMPAVPSASWAMIQSLVAPAFTIALLAAIESLLSAVVADGMTGDRHRSNMELVAQGIANMASPLFGGIPATGAIARTATNIKSGGRTPIAGIVHALVLLLILLVAGPLATRIPMAALAGILIIVAYHMSEWRTFRAYLKTPASDVAVLVTTFALTVIVDLTVALQVGMVLAAFLFMHRMSRVTNVQAVTGGAALGNDSDSGAEGAFVLPTGVELYEIDGPFFFGAAERFKETISTVGNRPRALILRLRRVPVIDATAISLLRDLATRCKREGTLLLLLELHSQPLIALERAGFVAELGEDHVVATLDAALARIAQNTVP